MKSRNEFNNNFGWLYYLQNNLGQNNLQIQCSWIKDENIIWSKRKKVMDILYTENEYDRKFIKNATHRTILDHEIVLDIDDLHPKFKTIKEEAIFYHNKLKEYNDIRHYTYFTGSKSYHIHIFIPLLKQEHKINREYFKKKFIMILGADILKIGNNMIAIEGQPHYKSNKLKKEVFL